MPDEDQRPRHVLDPAAWTDDPDTVGSPPDDLFESLADGTRRRILWYLLEEQRASREELLDVLLGWDLSGDAIAGIEDRERLAVELQHVHLPKLVDYGLVTRDDDTGEIRLAALSDAARDVVRLAYRYDRTVAGGDD
ncbi:MAG: hypothetical protein ABEI11_02360 [Haloarculaceae archaeon]